MTGFDDDTANVPICMEPGRLVCLYVVHKVGEWSGEAAFARRRVIDPRGAKPPGGMQKVHSPRTPARYPTFVRGGCIRGGSG